MVYVPYPFLPNTRVQSGFRQRYTWSGGSWVPFGALTVYQAPYRYRWASKGPTAGKKVKNSWGWWSPVRGYYRSACTLNYSGTRYVTVNSIGTFKEEYFGVCPSMTHVDLILRNGNQLNPTAIPILDTNFRNRLVAEARAKAAGGVANIGTMVGEGKQTLSQASIAVIAAIRLVRAIRNRDPRAIARLLGLRGKDVKSGLTVAQYWLSYQYGVKPLLQDIYDLLELYKKGLSQKEVGQLVSVVRNIPYSESVNFTLANGSVFAGAVQFNARCKLWYRVSDTDLDRLKALGLINPASVVWELVPFSFVIDWFLPIGTILEASTATIGLNFVDGVISQRYQLNAECLSYKSTVGMSSVVTDWKAHLAQSGLNRTKVSDTVVPYVKSPFSSTHVLNALALIRNLRK